LSAGAFRAGRAGPLLKTGEGTANVLETVRRVEKPWGYELIFAHTGRYAGKILHVEPGHALSLQYHERKEETLYLASGECEFEVEEAGDMVRRTLRQGDCYHVTPLTRHRMIAGPLGCEFIEVSSPELDDVVRLEDRYGRS
jgi:mannose-6-phosphate isomerase-like protein (cupin superfamily)